MDAIETEFYKGYTINIYPDDCPQEPFEYMEEPKGLHFECGVGASRRVILKGEEAEHLRDFFAWAGLITIKNYQGTEEACEEFANTHYWLPVYRHDHSGVAYNTTGFSCPWDSGLAGIISVPKAEAEKEWKEETEERALSYLKRLVKVYSLWANGSVYGYQIEDPEGTELDDGSCWGFYGYMEHDWGYMLKQAKEVVDSEIERRAAIEVRQLEVTIRGKNTDDFTLALEEVTRSVAEGFTSGMDRNETGSYTFSITEVKEEN